MYLLVKEKLHADYLFHEQNTFEQRNLIKEMRKMKRLNGKYNYLPSRFLCTYRSWFLSFVWLMQECSTYMRGSGPSLRKCIEAISCVTWHYVLSKLWAALEPLLTSTTFPYRIFRECSEMLLHDYSSRKYEFKLVITLQILEVKIKQFMHPAFPQRGR